MSAGSAPAIYAMSYPEYASWQHKDSRAWKFKGPFARWFICIEYGDIQDIGSRIRLNQNQMLTSFRMAPVVEGEWRSNMQLLVTGDLWEFDQK